MAATVSSLKPFETDGCTSFVDGTPTRPTLWKHCCVEHDIRYWFGGSMMDLDKTDLRLKSCVQEVAGDTWAEIIYTGVRLGHNSPVKFKFRWSWGWTPQRDNRALSKAETQYVIEQLRSLPLDPDLIEDFIKRNFQKKYAEI